MTTILVGTDTTAAADLAVEGAAELARAQGASLVLLLVKPDGDLRALVDPQRAADPDRHLTSLRERFPESRPRPGPRRATRPSASVRCADELQVDTIVVGNRGTHGKLVAGARTACPNLVLRHAPCSVYIVDTRRAQ